jgi:hypothetical protein
MQCTATTVFQNKKPGALSKHPGFLGMNVGYTIISEILGRMGDGSSSQSEIKDSRACNRFNCLLRCMEQTSAAIGMEADRLSVVSR